MAITLYNPKTKTFSTFTTPDNDLPLSEVVLLNILIELQTITQYLASDSSTLTDSPETTRSDIISTI